MNSFPDSAAQAARLIRSLTLNPLELTKFHLARIESENAKVNALRAINVGTSLAAAKKLQEEGAKGHFHGRLHGLTFSAKDSIDVMGLPRSEGTRFGAVDAAPRNAAIIQTLMDEGAHCIGKGNMAEYGKSYYTDNSAFGRTNNPFDLSLSPGGSGGGDAAALALNFCDFAIGSDAGGSVRVPANFCGLFGLFPTRGLLSSAGLTSYAHSVAQLFRGLGLLAKSSFDLEILFSVTSRYDRSDPYSVSEPIKKSSEPLRFCVLRTLKEVKCHSEILAELDKVSKRLEQVGWRYEEKIPLPISQCQEVFIILAAQGALLVEDALAKLGGRPRDLASESPILKNLRQRIDSELPALTAERVLTCWATVDRLRHEISTSPTFVLAPVCATLPPKHGTLVYEVEGHQLQSQDVFQFASVANVLGLPALAFPTGRSKSGLPLGVQLMGPKFSERIMLKTLREIGFTERIKP